MVPEDRPKGPLLSWSCCIASHRVVSKRLETFVSWRSPMRVMATPVTRLLSLAFRSLAAQHDFRWGTWKGSPCVGGTRSRMGKTETMR